MQNNKTDNFLNNSIGNIKQKKLGLALGSGGAKGMAHLGILKAFEEEGITFDIVVGTSIGSIVGGMYACGLSTENMGAYLSELGINDTQRLIKHKLQGLTLEKVLDRMLGFAEFDELKIPFSAVATDIDSGRQVVLSDGNVAKAMCASSAIPPLFRPVHIAGKRLVDGAYLNNVPADVAKQMGAHFVIGVNLAYNLPMNNQIKVILDALYPENKVPLTDRAELGEKFSDFMLYPDLTDYHSASYKKLDDMFLVGYELAKNNMPIIKQALERENIFKF